MKQGKILMLALMIMTLLIPAWAQDAAAQSRHGQGNCGNCLVSSAAAKEVLSQEAIEWLLYMREEEKLARDVYSNLYAEWGLLVFDKISQSEERHFAAIKTLLDRYNLSDPAAGKGVGEFTNPEIAKLYSDLMAEGILSVADALNAGITIENKDIADLEDARSSTKNRDILRVYTNLLEGSYNHLDAFMGHLQLLAPLP
jgi:hypothetical protein